MMLVSCEHVFGKDIALTFTSGQYQFSIKPDGYAFPSAEKDEVCFLPIEPADELRLGQIFLANYWVGLDFDAEEMLVGVIRLNNNAKINGIKHEEPKQPTPKKVPAAVHVPTFWESIVKDCTDMLSNPFGTISRIFNG